MTIKALYVAGIETHFDNSTHERVCVMAPVAYKDDFLGAGALVIPAAGSSENGVDWVKKIVGAAPPTVAGVANAAGGKVSCTLTADSQKEDAALYHGDQKNFDVTKTLVFEAVAQLDVLPSAAGVAWGLSGVWIDGPDNAAAYLEFGGTANGAVLLRGKDRVNTYSIASGVTLLAGVAHVFRIDATVLTDVRFFIDGVDVTGAKGTIQFAATGTAAVLQPYFAAYKPSGVGVATLTIDAVKVWTTRV